MYQISYLTLFGGSRQCVPQYQDLKCTNLRYLNVQFCLSLLLRKINTVLILVESDRGCKHEAESEMF